MAGRYRTPVNNIALLNARLYTTRLEPGQIRLLSFDQESEKWSFQTYSFGQWPPYVAVSYTWGPNEDTSYADDTVINKDGVPRYLSAIDHAQDFATSEGGVYSLEIDGENYRISRNVHELATRAIADGVEYLAWIDALCINQADPVERSAQVGMMGSIFYTAEYVLIWVGTDDRNEAGTVMDLCKAIQTEYLRQVGGGGRNASARKISNFWDAGVLEGMGLPPALDQRWEVFARFWSRRWFHRVWVLQEVVVGSNPRLWWGATEFDVPMLGDVSSFILQSQFPLFARLHSLSWQHSTFEWYQYRRRIGETLAKIRAFKFTVFPEPDEIDGQPHLIDSYDLQCETVGGSKIIDGKLRNDCMRVWANMLETNRAFDATDPRDYIFATLDIIDTAADNRDWAKTGITVDYTKSVAEVYADAAKRIMEASKCVNLISLAQDPQMRRQHDLPSWVPDFSARGEMPILLTKSRRWKLMPKLYKLAQSAYDLPAPVFHVHDNLRTVSLQAIRLDGISQVGESNYDLCDGGMWENTAQLLLSRESFVPGESRIESLWRMLVANTALDGDNIAGPDMAALFKSFVAVSLVMSVFKNPNHLEKLPTFDTLTKMHRAACDHDEKVATLPSFEYVREAVQYMDRVIEEVDASGQPPDSGAVVSQGGLFGNAMECMYYRRVLLTQSGGLGFGPLSTTPGDEIWLLPGMPLPTTLRKTQGNQYIVLGELYLHGDPDFSVQHGIEDWQWIELV